MLCFAVTSNGLAYSSNAAMAATVSSHSTPRAAHTQLKLAQAPNTTPQFDLRQHSTRLLPVALWQPGRNFMPLLKRVKATLEMAIVNHPVAPELRINVRCLLNRFKGTEDILLNAAGKLPIDTHDSSHFSCRHFYSFDRFTGTQKHSSTAQRCRAIHGRQCRPSSLRCAASGSDIPINEGVHCFAKRYEVTSPRCRTDFIRNECGHAPPHTNQGLSTSHRADKSRAAPQHTMLLKWFSDR
ncbi:hypothetical protein TRVL_06684 [Trypanosoma vivax]|nr:hypothetical protein TRVL_06684 [Trypanosoma vivax]